MRLQLRHLAPADLADDDLLGSLWELERRSRLAGREGRPFWTRQDHSGHLRSPDSGERQLLVTARDHDGRLVGPAKLWVPLLDNLDKAYAELDVDPPARGHGVGGALLDHLETEARAAGRTVLLVEATLPIEGRDEHAYAHFATSHGYHAANHELVRHLALPVPEHDLDAWARQAAERHDGYRLEVFVNDLPPEVVEGVCLLAGQLAVDAPTGTIDFEEEVMTPQRYAEVIASTRAMGRDHHEAVALAPDGTVAAQSTLAVPLAGGESEDVYQWGTFVHREHRGHRLGLAVKVANLRAAQQACPQARLVHTQNAETNDHMVAINDLMGFRPVEVVTEFLRRL